MADSVYVNLAPVIAAVNNAERSINNRITAEINVVNSKINQAMDEIARIQRQLDEMERQAKMRAALQKAVTEIIRVRQELDDKFGNHKEVRENMLGIIQATDSGLITKETMAKVSEELMLGAPRYWLAPCLIAIAAWIGDNRDLAERALKEALRRSEEKTSLLMALIMRRVNVQRIKHNKPVSNGVFAWLSKYFALQNPLNMNSNIVSYVDAYVNGIFGEDVDNLCGDSINQWMAQLAEANPNFKEDQIKYWKAIYSSFIPNYGTAEYQALKLLSPQYNTIMHFIPKIEAVSKEGGVRDYVHQINDKEINADDIINQIDNNLMTLVKNYDEDEVDLRDEEQYLSYVKEFEGDEEKAKRLMNAIYASRNVPNVDFANRLSQAILDKNQAPSVRKTAIKLLRSYMIEAFDEFINLGDEKYPNQIVLQINDKEGELNSKPVLFNFDVTDCSNKDDIITQVKNEYDSRLSAQLSHIKDDEANKKMKIGKILMCTIILFIIPVGPILYRKGKKMKEANDSLRAKKRSFYNGRRDFFVKQIELALSAKTNADSIYADYEARSNDNTLF